MFQFKFLCDISVLLISRLSSIFLDILGDCDRHNKRHQRKKVVDRYQLNVVGNLGEDLSVVMSVVSQKVTPSLKLHFQLDILYGKH